MNVYKELKESMRKAAKRAYDIRLQSGDGGNLSIRIPDKELILIKASGCSFGDIKDGNIVLVNFDGIPVSGKGQPSREIKTHIEIYKQRPDVTAIFHCHSPWAIACSMTSSAVPPVSLPMEMKIGIVPVLDVGDSHADTEVVTAVKIFLEKNSDINAFIQRRHGIFSMSVDILKAEHNAELVEEAAQIAQLIKIEGKLDMREIKNERI